MNVVLGLVLKQLVLSSIKLRTFFVFEICNCQLRVCIIKSF